MGGLTTGGIEQFAVKFQNSFIPYFETHYHYAYTLFTIFESANEAIEFSRKNNGE